MKNCKQPNSALIICGGDVNKDCACLYVYEMKQN